MGALALGEKAEVRRALVRLAEDAADAMVFKITPAAAWQKYLKSPNRPQSGPLTMENYAGLWRKFVKWAKGRREYLDDVTTADAATFIRTLFFMALTKQRILGSKGFRQ